MRFLCHRRRGEKTKDLAKGHRARAKELFEEAREGTSRQNVCPSFFYFHNVSENRTATQNLPP